MNVTKRPESMIPIKGIVGIFFGFPEGSDANAQMQEIELEKLGPITTYLNENGYIVAIKSNATAGDFSSWVDGSSELLDGVKPSAIIWSAHGGDDGSLQTCDGSSLRPSDLEQIKVSESLRLAVFSSCHTGVHARQWHSALDQRPTIVGWDGLARFGHVVQFYTAGDDTNHQLERLLRTYLLNPALESV